MAESHLESLSVPSPYRLVRRVLVVKERKQTQRVSGCHSTPLRESGCMKGLGLSP